MKNVTLILAAFILSSTLTACGGGHQQARNQVNKVALEGVKDKVEDEILDTPGDLLNEVKKLAESLIPCEDYFEDFIKGDSLSDNSEFNCFIDIVGLNGFLKEECKWYAEKVSDGDEISETMKEKCKIVVLNTFS